MNRAWAVGFTIGWLTCSPAIVLAQETALPATETVIDTNTVVDAAENSSATPTQPPAPLVVSKPEEPAKITDKSHPDFVRCRSEQVLGSRASRVRVCRTNREWQMAARAGNRDTETLMNSGRPLQPLP